MPSKLHTKVKKSLRKAHPTWSAATLEEKTDQTLTSIGQHSARKGTYPGPPRSRFKTRSRTSKKSGKK